MNVKDLKNRSAKMMAGVSLKIGKVSANSACSYLFHQPPMPADLKSLKKKYE